MNEKRDAETREPKRDDGRLPWTKPTLRRISAASAELGPHAAVTDGGFTNS